MELTPEQIIREHYSALGRKGAAALNASKTPEERSKMARKAALKRWRAYRKAKREKK